MLLTEKTLTETLFPCRLKVQIHNNSNICILYAQYVYWHCTGQEKLKVQSKWTKRVCSCLCHPTSDILQQLLQVLQVFRFYSTSSQTCIANTAMLCIMTSWRLHNEINEKVIELDRGTPVWWNVSETHLTSPSTLQHCTHTVDCNEEVKAGWSHSLAMGCTVYSICYIQLLTTNCCYENIRLNLQHTTPPFVHWSCTKYVFPLTPTPTHSQPHPNTSTPKASHPYPHTPTLSHPQSHPHTLTGAGKGLAISACRKV